MLKSDYIRQCRLPEGKKGRLLLNLMDLWHRPFSSWVLNAISMPENACVLDTGCGSGLYLRKLLAAGCMRADGIDPSELCVRRTLRTTGRYRERCSVLKAAADLIPFPCDSYDAVIAADTVIYWNDIRSSFSEVYRVLRRGGAFYIASELSDEKDAPSWIRTDRNIIIRTPEELSSALHEAGFSNVSVVRVKGPWLLIKAEKQEC